MSDPSLRRWHVGSVPRALRAAFVYAPLSSIPILILGTLVYPLLFGGGDYLTWAVVSVLYGVPATYVVIIAVGLPAVLVLRRCSVSAVVAWIGLGTLVGLAIGSVFPVAGTWPEVFPEQIVWLALGAVTGGWNAFLLWRASQRAEEPVP